MPNTYFNDTGRATDRPKGFVRWSLIAYWTAILGLSSFIGVLLKESREDTIRNQEKIENILMTTQETIDQIRVEYNNKLEERLKRVERLEKRVDETSNN